MEVDLLKPQVSKFKLRQRIRRLEYEGIHLVCLGYGLYGHKMDSYPLDQKEPMAAPKEGMENDLSDILTIRDKEMLRKDDNFIKPKILETYGSWMLATCDGININNVQPDFIPSCENLIGNNLIEQ